MQYRARLHQLPQVKESIIAYQTNSAHLNGRLRKGLAQCANTKNLDQALRISPTVENYTVYRGIGRDVADKVEMTTTDWWVEPSFVSTSRLKRTARKFAGAGGVVLKLQLTVPTPVIPVYWLSKRFIHEREVVLPRDCQMKVVRVKDETFSVKTIGGGSDERWTQTVVTVNVVPPNNGAVQLSLFEQVADDGALIV